MQTAGSWERYRKAFEAKCVTVSIDDPHFARYFIVAEDDIFEMECQPDMVVATICKWLEMKTNKEKK